MAKSSKRRTSGRSTARTASVRTPRSTRTNRRGGAMVFTRKNYQLLVIGLVVIIVGYTMMRMDNQVESFISLYLAPLLILGGYLEIIYAILWQPKSATDEEAAPAG